LIGLLTASITQVRGDRLSTGDEVERELVDLALVLIDARVVDDHALSEAIVSPNQRLDRTLDLMLSAGRHRQ